MNVLKIMFTIIIIFFSLSFFLIGGWGIIALFYSIAYLIVILTKTKRNSKTNNTTNELVKLSNLISQKEMITEEEFNNIKAEVYGIKL